MFDNLIRLLPPLEVNAPRTLSIAAILAAAFVTLFIVTEILLAAAATVWALAGLFHLHMAAIVVLAVIIGVPAIWGSVVTGMMAFAAETDPENN